MMNINPSNKRTYVCIILSILIFISLSCSSILIQAPTITSTPTQSLTQTPTKTLTRTPTETQTPEQAVYPAAWKMLFSDSFDNNQNNWQVMISSGDWGLLDPSIKNGKYVILLKSGDRGLRLPLYQTELSNIKNFYYSVDVEQNDQSMDAYYGLLFRISEERGYVFLINSESCQYILGYSDETNWTTIIDWITSSSILKEKVNNIGIVAIDEKIKIVINGNEIENISDLQKTTMGGFGLTVGLYNGNEQVIVQFDNLVVFGP